MLMVLLLLLLCGPLFVAASSFFLIGASGAVLGLPTVGTGAVVAVLVIIQLLAAAAVNLVYRWCFARPADRGAALLAALLVSVFALSNQQMIEAFGALTVGSIEMSALAPLCLSLLLEGATVLGVALSACMVGALVLEIPLRWAQGERMVVSDGAFRMLRVIGVILLCVISSALVREQGMSRLLALLKRAIA
jgi:hypothetical protein